MKLLLAGVALAAGGAGLWAAAASAQTDHSVYATQTDRSVYATQTEPPVTRPPSAEVRAGRDLFQVSCSSCHGLNGEGTPDGPSLIGVGAASADFYLTTGRMPLDTTSGQAQRKPPAYTPREIRQLVAYVASLGPGPPIPRVNLADGDLAEGLELFANNCAPCHSSAGAGGALGHANYAPRLGPATPVQVAEAVKIGPGPMPVFGPEIFDSHELNSIVRYVEYLKHPDDRGGLGLGHLGPIPEGFVAWVVGLGLIVVAIRWIGTRD
ncbi:MAG: cytochrome bc1 complex diheme cytochrome c subunit [Acidimicrobiales bacterium]